MMPVDGSAQRGRDHHQAPAGRLPGAPSWDSQLGSFAIVGRFGIELWRLAPMLTLSIGTWLQVASQADW